MEISNELRNLVDPNSECCCEHSLGNKCKNWALSKGYFIYSTNELSFIKTFSLETIETFSNGKDTEIECIIKACEWLLKERI